MKRIETTQEALAAANEALDFIKAIQAAKIQVVAADSVDISLAAARSDLEFVCRLFALSATPPERCPHHSPEDGSRYCRKCGVPLPYEEKSK